MCNILVLEPGVMPDKDKFINMCYNNWHGYGLVTLVDGKLDVTRKSAGDGEIDHKELWDLLERDRQFQRIVHVRHNTAGNNDLTNCHPFDVFYSDKRQVVFMHNGTMHEYKSRKYNKNLNRFEDDDDGPSDTRNYVEKVLIPYLTSTDHGGGHGDLQHPFTKWAMNKFFPSGNRGILISNDQPFVLLGDWKEIKNSNGDTIKTSNTDYFDEVKRGPEKERRDNLKKAQEAKVQAKDGGKGEIVPLSNFQFDRKASLHDLDQSLAKIFEDWTFWDRDCTVNLAFATKDELSQLADDKAICIGVMDWVFTDYHKLYEENADLQNEVDDLEDKLDRAGHHIAKLKKEIAELKINGYKPEAKDQAA